MAKKSDSSGHPRLKPGAEESPFFTAPGLGGVQVQGRVAGWSHPKAPLKALLSHYLAALGFPKAGLELQLVDDQASRALNLRHRGVDAPTDVLSFPACEDGTLRQGYA